MFPLDGSAKSAAQLTAASACCHPQWCSPTSGCVSLTCRDTMPPWRSCPDAAPFSGRQGSKGAGLLFTGSPAGTAISTTRPCLSRIRPDVGASPIHHLCSRYRRTQPGDPADRGRVLEPLEREPDQAIAKDFSQRLPAYLRTAAAGGRWCLPTGTTVLACGPAALSDSRATKRTSAPTSRAS